MKLLTLQFFSSLHALLGNDSLYTLDENSVRQRKAVKQLQCTILDLSLVFALL